MTTRKRSASDPVWAEIDLRAIGHNLRAIRKHIGAKRKVLAIVKADAYGHGAVPVARALAKAGADCFGVTCTSEGAELREAGIRQPIVALTGFWPGEERALLEYGLTPTITDVEQMALLEKAAAKLRKKAVPFHLKIDTGMNRLGILPREVPKFVAALADCRRLRLAGTFTHFAAAEDFTVEQTDHQQRVFETAIEQLRAAGVDPGIVHLANSAAIAARPAAWADMVRPGALLYGYHQFYAPPERRAEMQRTMPLRPAMSLRARIVSVKQVPAGQAVGYNARFVTQRPSRLAVMSAGYAEGVVRLLTNRGRVIIGGRCAPLVGAISMDLAMIDVTALPEVRVGDVATIYGAPQPRGKCALDASDVAGQLGTVTSELLCAVGKRVPRVYLS